MSKTRINLCEESSEYIDQLFDRFKLAIPSFQIGGLYKIAFAKGLANLPQQFGKRDSKGKEIRVDPFEGPIFDALIRQKFRKPTLEDKYIYYKAAIDLGAILIKTADDGNEDAFTLLNTIIRDSKFLPKKMDGKHLEVCDELIHDSAKPIYIGLGKGVSHEELTVMWNDKNNTGQHIGVCGKTGCGKTQLILEVASQVAEKSSNKVSIIFLDYAKGDVAANKNFIDIIKGEAIDVANEGVPFNPFYLEAVDDIKIEELKEIFCSIQKGLGPKQSLELFDILKEAYETNEDVDLEYVYQSIIHKYESAGKQKDILVELFHKLNVPQIFPSASSNCSITDLLKRNIVFDLHKINSNMKIKELITFLILNKIYTEAIKLPDSEIDPQTNAREIRTMIIIDEAHNYLNCENRVLEKMLRELRSKGVAVVLLTQSYNDFHQKNFDYSSMLGWTFIMKSDNNAQELCKALAVEINEAKSLAKEVALVDTGVVYTRPLISHEDGYTKFDANLFWKRFSHDLK